jgi:hypothetical protein
MWSRKRIQIDTDKEKVEQIHHDLDLNQVSEQQLKAAKVEMDILFCANKINPDTEGYVYDKRVDFDEVQSESSWD